MTINIMVRYTSWMKPRVLFQTKSLPHALKKATWYRKRFLAGDDDYRFLWIEAAQ